MGPEVGSCTAATTAEEGNETEAVLCFYDTRIVCAVAHMVVVVMACMRLL
jgi:hypothetical protein